MLKWNITNEFVTRSFRRIVKLKRYNTLTVKSVIVFLGQGSIQLVCHNTQGIGLSEQGE